MLERESADESRARYLPDPEPERSGLALCLSGGGYRAALFHLGALRRLNELGALTRVDTISGVSGGSILGAFLANQLEASAENQTPWTAGEPIPNFTAQVVDPFRDFTRKNIRTLWILRRLLRPWDSTVAVENLTRRYKNDIFQGSLSELPQHPRFIFSATDMAFGVNWVSERERVGSYVPGYVEPPPDWAVARAVAASSCFPPAFEPMPVRIDPADFKGGKTPERAEGRAALIRGMRLTDGGVYDNLALEPVWKNHEAVLVSDGGATFDFTPDRGAFKRLGRYTSIQGRQAGAIRKRWLLSNFLAKELKGTYWGVGSATDSYAKQPIQGYAEPLVDEVISEVRTDLDHFTDAEAQVLQNHGYLVTAAAMETHAREWCAREVHAQVPYPAWMDEKAVRKSLAKSNERRLLGRWFEPR